MVYTKKIIEKAIQKNLDLKKILKNLATLLSNNIKIHSEEEQKN